MRLRAAGRGTTGGTARATRSPLRPARTAAAPHHVAPDHAIPHPAAPGAAAPETATHDTGALDAAAPAPALTIVVPAFDEADRMDGGALRLQAAIDGGAVDPTATELVVVDDGSTDATAERARQLYGHLPHLRVLSLPANAGKGAAIRAGVAHARGAHVAFMDADMAIDPSQLPRMTAALAGADLAIGARSLPGSVAEGDTVGRTAMGWIFNRAVNATTRVHLGDTQCGFKAFRTPVARLLFHGTVIDRFAFDVELLVLARRLGLRIAEEPVRWRNVSGSSIHPLRDAWSMTADMLRSRLRLAVPPPIEALAVAGDPGMDATTDPATNGAVGPAAHPPADPAALGALGTATAAVGPTVPVLARRDAGALVLFPLGSADEVSGAAERLTALVGPARVRRLAVTLDQVAALAPLRVHAGTAGTAATA